MQVIANGPHDDFPGVETHAHAQLQATAATHLLRVGAHGGLHGQGRVAGAQGVVFVGNGSTEQGHNAITKHLVDGALEAVHGVHHVVDGGIEELLGGFRVEAADEFRRVFEVGKHHRDVLALAFQGGARGASFVREMWWRVGKGYAVPGCHRVLAHARKPRARRRRCQGHPSRPSRAQSHRPPGVAKTSSSSFRAASCSVIQCELDLGGDRSRGPAGAAARSPDPPPRQSPPRVLPAWCSANVLMDECIIA